jgi:hypothetical protein
LHQNKQTNIEYIPSCIADMSQKKKQGQFSFFFHEDLSSSHFLLFEVVLQAPIHAGADVFISLHGEFTFSVA